MHEAISEFYLILDILGLKFDFPSYSLSTKLLIKKWQQLRREKKYNESDEIRKRLQDIDIL